MMKYYLCLSKIGPATAFTSRDDAERFKVSRLDDKHAEVVEVVSADVVRRALLNLPRIYKGGKSTLYWVAVKDLFGYGSSTAIELCNSFGINPHSELQDGAQTLKNENH